MPLIIRFISILLLGCLTFAVLAEDHSENHLQNAQVDALIQQAHNLIQQARETGDGDFYDQAEALLQHASEGSSPRSEILNGLALVEMIGHQFAAARDLARQAISVNERSIEAWGLLTDASIELGDYATAIEAAEQMMRLRPDIATFTRVAYLRELHGDVDGAIAAMKTAIGTGGAFAEHVAWCHSQLGNLYLQSGQLEQAERSYRNAMALQTDYPAGAAGLARVFSARGNDSQALLHAALAVEQSATVEHISLYGDVLAAAGLHTLAEAQYQQAFQVVVEEKDGGMDVDDEMAWLAIELDKDSNMVLGLARQVFERRPTIEIADLLAWSYYYHGDFDNATRYAEKALKLGTKSANTHFRAGMIAFARGDNTKARQHLESALAINPYFSEADAKLARKTLQTLIEG